MNLQNTIIQMDKYDDTFAKRLNYWNGGYPNESKYWNAKLMSNSTKNTEWFC